MLKSNAQIDLAREFLHSTGANLFLTGRAGTGKTTFLRSVVQSVSKRTVVAAPTGVAALNARGVTLHSLFQLPFGLNLPDMKHNDMAFRKISRKKLALIRSIELLVIDEISMVRCDLLDAVDETLRQIRRSSRPFGGVQLLMIGDIEQLSPICREDEWELLSRHYSSPYFFASKALERCQYITIELKEIFRQRDPDFTALLNAVRENKITPAVVDALNARYIPAFEPDDAEGYITLTTHNATANKINEKALAKINEPSHYFTATTSGDYPESAYPNEENLELKVGAQVIFIKNDISPEKLYYNGLIGRIDSIEDDRITVQPSSGGAPIEISKLTWENIEYRIDDQSGEIEESVKGTFSQIPLKKAWAITIHKSQGLSFDKAIIDAGSSFAHGQVYVALSRCRTFEGMVLRTPISGGSIIRDNSVEGFAHRVAECEVGEAELAASRRDYYHSLLGEVFDFEQLNRATYSLAKLFNSSLYREYPHLCKSLRQTTQSANAEIAKVGANFTQQLERLIRSSEDYLSDDHIAERLSKAAIYFAEKLAPIGILINEACGAKSDAKDIAKRLKTLLVESKEAYTLKAMGVKECAEGFDPERYLKAKFAIITSPPDAKAPKAENKSKSTVPSDIINEKLYEALAAWRLDLARSIDKPAFTILTNRSLIEIQATCPKTIDALGDISGIGETKLKQYGDQILEIVQEYTLYNNASDDE